MTGHVLVIDQGTTSTRSMIFGPKLEVVATAQREFEQLYPQSGWVEHDPEALWSTALQTARDALASARLNALQVAALGITNQRETTLVWDRATGQPIYNAIVWQDRRTAGACDALEAADHGEMVARLTGLRLDPYFSATKIGWILDRVPGARARAEAGHLAFGTVDSFLLWRLTDGAVHATDATNASRTLLCDIATGAWHDDLLALFRIPRAMLPEIRDSAGAFGTTHLLGGVIPVRGIAGDQQAALIGQGCLSPGMVKATYGTGAFVLLHVGREARPLQPPHAHHHRLAAPRRGASTRWRARSSRPALGCSGCVTGWAWWTTPPPPASSRRGLTPRKTSISCPPSPGLARRIGTATPAPPSAASAAAPPAASWRAPCWRVWRIRRGTCWTQCSATSGTPAKWCCASMAA